MGWRFRKSIKILPGVKLNINKKSTSFTFGTKGCHYTINSEGKRTASAGIPGTGLYYTESSTKQKHKNRKDNLNSTKPIGCGTIVLYFIICIVFIGFLSNFGNKNPPKNTTHRTQEKSSAQQSVTLSQYNTTELSIEVNEHDDLTFYLEPSSIKMEDIEIINSNDSVALCILQDVRSVPTGRIAIVSYRGIAEGTAELYVKIKNSETQSEVISISVNPHKPEADSSRTVYLNYSGSKYHYSRACAGETAYESTLNQALRKFKEPCSKCVH